MENLLVIIIVALAGAYIVRTFYRRWKGEEDCGCGCSSCDIEATCDDPKKGREEHREIL